MPIGSFPRLSAIPRFSCRRFFLFMPFYGLICLMTCHVSLTLFSLFWSPPGQARNCEYLCFPEISDRVVVVWCGLSR